MTQDTVTGNTLKSSAVKFYLVWLHYLLYGWANITKPDINSRFLCQTCNQFPDVVNTNTYLLYLVLVSLQLVHVKLNEFAKYLWGLFMHACQRPATPQTRHTMDWTVHGLESALWTGHSMDSTDWTPFLWPPTTVTSTDRFTSSRC